MNWCILIPLLVGLISALLGYLLGKLLGGGDSSELTIWKDKVAKLEADLDACNKSKLELEGSTGSVDVDLGEWESKVAKLEADLHECKKSKLMLGADLKSAQDNLGIASLAAQPVEADLPFDADTAKAVFGKKIKQDDLKIVEGIGPKIEGLFHNFDIKTWKALGATSVEKCQEVLDSGGDRYKIHNPGTWPKQAQLAYEGKWAELLKWQDELDGGKA